MPPFDDIKRRLSQRAGDIKVTAQMMADTASKHADRHVKKAREMAGQGVAWLDETDLQASIDEAKAAAKALAGHGKRHAEKAVKIIRKHAIGESEDYDDPLFRRKHEVLRALSLHKQELTALHRELVAEAPQLPKPQRSAKIERAAPAGDAASERKARLKKLKALVG
jgi:hypothetical protein